MYRVNVVYDDGREIVFEKDTETDAIVFENKCKECVNVVSTRLLRPAKDAL